MPDETERALVLLRAVLPDAMREDLDVTGSFVVRGSAGGRYRIRMGRSGNVSRFAEDGTVTDHFCAHPAESVPDPDTVLAQYLLLITDEPAFLAVANRHGPLMTAPLQPQVLPADGSERIMPAVPNEEGMARLRLIRSCLATRAGREALAAAVVARIHWGGGADADVAAEVTEIARVVVLRAEGDEPTESILALRTWLVQAPSAEVLHG